MNQQNILFSVEFLDAGYQELCRIVIRADDESHAREIAIQWVRDEGLQESWDGATDYSKIEVSEVAPDLVIIAEEYVMSCV